MRKIVSILFALKFIVLLGAVGVTMFCVGYTKIRNASQSSPKTYGSVDEIDVNGPKWITINSCSLDIHSSAYLDELTGGKIEEIFIPFRSNKSLESTGFYLNSKDHLLVSAFNMYHALVELIHSEKMNIEMSKNDPDYLEFQKTTLAKLEQKLRKTEQELEFYSKKHASLVKSVSGMLDLEFDKNEIYKLNLGGDNVHIIRHNGKPEAGFYAWFLVIVGGILSVLSILSFIGFFKKKGKNESKS